MEEQAAAAAAPPPPVVLGATDIAAALSYALLIDCLRKAFANSHSISTPLRHHHSLSPSSTLLLMPAWSLSPSSPYLGVKLVTVFPHNASSALPSVSASYLLSSSSNGSPLAFLDGTELTLWRTSCVSALASYYLSRPDSRSLLMIGAGSLAPHLIKAHLASRPSIQRILIWNRTHSRAQLLAKALETELTETTVLACSDLERAARSADVISCATLSEQPLVLGSWLKPGVHLDLVGSFTPIMRECDDEAISKGKVYIDTSAACLEAGELVSAFNSHSLDIKGTLSQLATSEKPGRQLANEITVFKSVGCALVDLATAQLVYERLHVLPLSQ